MSVVSLGKSKIESMCRAAGCVPVKRAIVGGTEVFIADGFNADASTFRRFEVEKEDFPYGVFATFWWTFEDDEKFSLGRPLFFDAFHDKGYSPESKQKMRIEAALKDAEENLAVRKKATKH